MARKGGGEGMDVASSARMSMRTGAAEEDEAGGATHQVLQCRKLLIRPHKCLLLILALPKC